MAIEHAEELSFFEGLLVDSNFWVAVSFVVFAAIVFHFGKKFGVSKLDEKIESIRQELKEAENLRVEAQEMLAQYQRKQRDAEGEAKAIVSKAEEHAAKIRASAETELAASMARKEEQLAERLRRIEENAIAEIQNHAAELAVSATTQIISEALNDNVDDDLKKQTIQSLSSTLK